MFFEPSPYGMEVYTVSPVEHVRASLVDGEDHGSSVAFQSTIAAAAKAVSRALALERGAEQAALSLAHRRLLSRLRSELEVTVDVLDRALPERARCLLDPPDRSRRKFLARKDGRKSAPDWDEALGATMSVLRDGAELLADLAGGQPEDAPARAVAEASARLLQEHHEQLRGHAAPEYDA